MQKWGPLASRYTTEQPRKILSLDGGGIRGVLTLEILFELEKQLKIELKGDDNFCLGNYFDYIGLFSAAIMPRDSTSKNGATSL